ncbi:MAG: aminotransferase class I/II-fold pyridoxal phosphate-dependent enzyme [Microthrixaceae bacterium]|nr:aminotransferase class I/II-fold pyridoxal phosphate-dependent enzyme [Microthrixaceae bacterium]
MSTGFVPPAYPYDRLGELHEIAGRLDGGAVDLSIGTPKDPPPAVALEALATSDTERGYPPSIGTPQLREAAVEWFANRFGVRVPTSGIAACVGSKELVAGLPHWLRLRSPELDTVLYPAVSYPSYAMGATLAGCRAVPVAMDEHWRVDLGSIDPRDARRALCLWVNTPGNPAGALDDLGAAAGWGRENGVPVFSDECYAEFTWSGEPAVESMPPGRTILEHGVDGVVAVHSLSKRSNLAGLRLGFYAGDGDLVEYLSEVRKHAGFMVPGPVQAAGVAALGSQDHVEVQRGRYLRRLEETAQLLAAAGVPVALPDGGFYLWVPAPSGDAWELARQLASTLGVVGSPGEFYGPAAAGHLRLAMVQPDREQELLRERAG